MKLKTGDKVVVISGANKGKEGKITKVLDEKVIVEGVNVCKKHLKPKGHVILATPYHMLNVSNKKESIPLLRSLMLILKSSTTAESPFGKAHSLAARYIYHLKINCQSAR